MIFLSAERRTKAESALKKIAPHKFMMNEKTGGGAKILEFRKKMEERREEWEKSEKEPSGTPISDKNFYYIMLHTWFDPTTGMTKEYRLSSSVSDRTVYSGISLRKLAKAMVSDLPDCDFNFMLRPPSEESELSDYIHGNSQFVAMNTCPSQKTLQKLERYIDREIMRRNHGWRGLFQYYRKLCQYYGTCVNRFLPGGHDL